uniref:uncharacterized protein n=1 Tax=Myxine glutinosa TaxID=7769 RepID=UPI0035902C0E
MEAYEQCVICKQSVDGGGSSVSTLGEKGSSSINQASKKRGDNIHAVPGDKIHKDCRWTYINPQQIAKDTRQQESETSTSSESPTLRSTTGRFSYSTDCLFCGTPAQFGKKRKKPSEVSVFQVRTIEFKDTLLATCRARGDDWSETVKARILHVHDLHAADAVYHQTCSVNFRTYKQIPVAYQTNTEDSKRRKAGRPVVDERTAAFLEVVKYIEETDDEQITINDLIDLMQQKLAHSEHEPYGYTHMKRSRQKHFGEKIIYTEINGKPNVVTLSGSIPIWQHQDTIFTPNLPGCTFSRCTTSRLNTQKSNNVSRKGST